MSLPLSFLDQRPIVVAIAGSNGAGKSTFFETYLADSGLRFVNADVIAHELQISLTMRRKSLKPFDRLL